MSDVYSSLPELYANRAPDDTRRPYRVTLPNDTPTPDTPDDECEYFVLSTSPAQAALAAIERMGGKSELVSQREQLKAAMAAAAGKYKADHPTLFPDTEDAPPEPGTVYKELLTALAEAPTAKARAKLREEAITARTQERITLAEATEIQDLIQKANEAT